MTCTPSGSYAAANTDADGDAGRAASTVVACPEVVRTRDGVGDYPELRAAPLDGLEPPTQRLGRARSIQLSYRGTLEIAVIIPDVRHDGGRLV